MKTFEVHVSLFSVFRSGRFASGPVRLNGPSTVACLLGRLEIPAEDVGVVMVNGKDGTFGTRLTGGDRVTLIPSIGGG